MATNNNELCLCGIMEKLPDEILLHIFSKLPLLDLISGARQTCWRWYHLSKDASLWTILDLSAFKCSYVQTDVHKLHNGVRNLLHGIQDNLESLTFSNTSVDGGVYELFGSAWKHKNKAKFKNLKFLDYSYSNVSPRNLRVALTTHSDIEEIMLSYTKISFSQAMEEAIHLPKLKVLVYHDSQSWDNIMNNFMDHHHEEDRFINKLNVMKVPKHCPLLEVVELHTIRANLDNEVIQQFSKFCKNLKKLSFTWSTNLTVDAFSSLNIHSQCITELGLLDRQETGPYLNFVLPHFPHLLRLTVNGKNVNLEDCIAIGECCPKLQELTFEITGIRSKGGLFEYYLCKGNSLCGLELQKVVQKCKDLRKLHAPFSNIDDDSVIFLSEQCRFLEDINFTQCHRLTSESLFALSKNSVCLKRVNFQDTTVDHKYILGLVSKCRRLEEVVFDHKSPSDVEEANVSVCSSLCSDDSQTEDIPVPDARVSQTDDIPYIDMTPSSEECELRNALLQGLSNIDTDNISRDNNGGKNLCISATQVTYFECFEHFPVPRNHCHIKRLSLKNSTTKEQYLLDIFTRCPDLTYISLDSCSSLTNHLITTIAKSCPNLKTLNISFGVTQESKSKFGDAGLLALVKYCHHLETLSFLYNHNITPVGLAALFQSLDGPLRSLESLSLCVGRGYPCSASVIALHGLKHLTEQSKRELKDAAATARSNSYMIFHLDFNKRKLIPQIL